MRYDTEKTRSIEVFMDEQVMLIIAEVIEDFSREYLLIDTRQAFVGFHKVLTCDGPFFDSIAVSIDDSLLLVGRNVNFSLGWIVGVGEMVFSHFMNRKHGEGGILHLTNMPHQIRGCIFPTGQQSGKAPLWLKGCGTGRG
jgi:hypothetical protein